MQPDLSTIVPRFAPNFGLTLAVLGFAVVATVVAARSANAPALRHWQRWFNVLVVSSWVVAMWLVGLRLLSSASALELLAKGVLLLAFFTATLPVARDVVAGLVMGIEGRHRLADDVRIEGQEGRLVRMGLRSITLRLADHTELTIPNRRFMACVIEHLDSSVRDALCEVEVPLPPGLDVIEASRRLTEAASLSPFAAPGRLPEVFPVADPTGGLRLRIRGYVFDRAHEEQFRGDVLARTIDPSG